MTVALVPMKDLPNAKQRLSSVLSKEERIGLVNAMLGDVLAALAKAETIDAVNIIAHDQNFSEFNVGFIQEAKNAGYNEAVGFALECAEIADASAPCVCRPLRLKYFCRSLIFHDFAILSGLLVS